MTTASRVAGAWEAFQASTGGINRPETEAEYEALRKLADELTDRYNCNEEPHASLFDLIASYLHAWELMNEPELKDPDVPPHRMLAYYMEERGVTQYQLAKEGVANQGNLSAILQGKRSISKTLAKKLAERFGVNVEVFL